VTLDPWLPEVRALARDVRAATHGRQQDLAGVTISVPSSLDPDRLARALSESLAAQGMKDVVVSTERGDGPTAIVALEFER